MAKKSSASPVNKKHLAREQRERRVMRWLFAALAVTLALVAGLLLYGWYDQAVLAPASPLVTINGQGVPADDVSARLKLIGGSDPTSAADTALNQVIEDLLIEEEFGRRGLVVSEGEVQQALQRFFRYYPEGTPTPRPTFTPDPTLVALATLIPSATPGLGSSTPTGPLPTATEYTQQAFDEALKGYLAAAGVTEDQLRQVIRASLVRAALQADMERDVPREQEQVMARHILVQSEAEARIALDRLGEGEDWEALAAELSLDESNKTQGGELGWFGRGLMTPAFEEAAFTGEIGTVVGPIETPFGWHLIDIQDRQVRLLDDFDYQLAVDAAFRTWLDERRAAAEIDIPEDWRERLIALYAG